MAGTLSEIAIVVKQKQASPWKLLVKKRENSFLRSLGGLKAPA
jgi:hypothetical protein